MKPLFVLCGIDAHLERIKDCIESIKMVYVDTPDIAIATFGMKSLPVSVKLKSYCEENNYLFYDAPRQNYIGQKKQCEIIGMFDISRYFQKDYDEVYLLHNDLVVYRDFVPLYKQKMIGNWSFIAPLIRIREGKGVTQLVTFKNSEEFGKSNLRITQAIIIFNKNFINMVYEQYPNHNVMWNLFKDKMWCGDVALFDIRQHWFGYDAEFVDETIMLEKNFTFRYDGDFYEYVKQHEDIKFVHGIGCKE